MRRIIDILFAGSMLFLLSPILLMIALAVVLDSPGGALYGGLRAGQGGRSFRMWKFRTMVTGANKWGPITGKNDARVTRIGRFLRTTKLDELPQLFNVFAGDMTLVGPRPEAPEIVALYRPDQRTVLAVKPGVTGRVQLDSGDESETIPEAESAHAFYVAHLMESKLRRDLEYLKSRTPLTDTAIVLQTATVVFRRLLRG